MGWYCGLGWVHLSFAYYLSGLSTAVVVQSSHYGEERLVVEKWEDKEQNGAPVAEDINDKKLPRTNTTSFGQRKSVLAPGNSG